MNKVDEVRKDKKLGISFKASNDLKKYIFGDSVDELIDGLALLEDARFINEFVCKFPDLTEVQLVRLDTLMLKISNAQEIVSYAIKRAGKLTNRDYFEERLVKFRDISGICAYVESCQVNNMDAFVEVICEEKRACSINWIAKVDGADLFRLKKAIFQTDDIYELIEFCVYCQRKADNIITQEDVQKVEQLVIDKDIDLYARVCAEDLKGVNIVKMQYVVENSGNAEEILNFAKYVSGADIAGLRKAILRTKDVGRIARFMEEFGTTGTSKKLWWFSKKKN